VVKEEGPRENARGATSHRDLQFMKTPGEAVPERKTGLSLA
jgi:hypothetical protein